MLRPVVLPRAQTSSSSCWPRDVRYERSRRCRLCNARTTSTSSRWEMSQTSAPSPRDQRPGSLVNVKEHGLRQKFGERDAAGEF
jgi:hypothetical protein